MTELLVRCAALYGRLDVMGIILVLTIVGLCLNAYLFPTPRR